MRRALNDLHFFGNAPIAAYLAGTPEGLCGSDAVKLSSTPRGWLTSEEGATVVFVHPGVCGTQGGIGLALMQELVNAERVPPPTPARGETR